LSQCKEIWRFFLNFGRILAIESFKNNMILAISIFNAAFWLYKASKKKKAGNNSMCSHQRFRDLARKIDFSVCTLTIDFSSL